MYVERKQIRRSQTQKQEYSASDKQTLQRTQCCVHTIPNFNSLNEAKTLIYYLGYSTTIILQFNTILDGQKFILPSGMFC